MSDIEENKRGSFHAAYALPKNAHPLKVKTHRLMDLMLVIVGKDSEQFLTPGTANEFAVIDIQREEKGWFELPQGYGPEAVTAMIQSTFNARALRVSPRIWIV